TWRQGFEDWVALSEVAELAGWLAPRPQRPVFSPASSPSSPVPVVPVPVESAFAAGGVMRTVRAEVPTPVPDSGGWKPSASAALRDGGAGRLSKARRSAARAGAGCSPSEPARGASGDG